MLTQALSWHWIFFVNVPIGAVAIVAGGLLLAGERASERASERGAAGFRRLRDGADVTGALLVTAGLMTAVYAIVETSRLRLGLAAHGRHR